LYFSSGMGLIRTILIILLIYGAVVLFRKYIWPLLVRSMARGAERYVDKKMENMRNEARGEDIISDKDGVRITRKKDRTQGPTDQSLGEEIDYEELN
jgi:hypothetical protein